MQKLKKYDFSKPIKIIQYKSPRFDIIFYSFLLSLLMAAVFYLIFIHDGKFVIQFKTLRVIIAFPLVILCYFLKELLDELRIYPKLLMKKHIWTLDELMKLTNKDEDKTKKIISHVLESSFIVDKKNIIDN